MTRVFALILGLIGVVVAFTINLLYSSLHVLGRVAGITNDQTHFFWGLFVILIGLVGSVLAMFIPIAGASRSVGLGRCGIQGIRFNRHPRLGNGMAAVHILV